MSAEDVPSLMELDRLRCEVEEVQEVQPEKKSEDFKLEEEAEDDSGEKVDSSDAVFNEFLNN